MLTEALSQIDAKSNWLGFGWGCLGFWLGFWLGFCWGLAGVLLGFGFGVGWGFAGGWRGFGFAFGWVLLAFGCVLFVSFEGVGLACVWLKCGLMLGWGCD